MGRNREEMVTNPLTAEWTGEVVEHSPERIERRGSGESPRRREAESDKRADSDKSPHRRGEP